MLNTLTAILGLHITFHSKQRKSWRETQTVPLALLITAWDRGVHFVPDRPQQGMKAKRVLDGLKQIADSCQDVQTRKMARALFQSLSDEVSFSAVANDQDKIDEKVAIFKELHDRRCTIEMRLDWAGKLRPKRPKNISRPARAPICGKVILIKQEGVTASN